MQKAKRIHLEANSEEGVMEKPPRTKRDFKNYVELETGGTEKYFYGRILN